MDCIMIQRFTIQGRFPSLNDYISAERANKSFGASMKRRETKRAASAAEGLAQCINPVIVGFKWVEPNLRRDADNVAFAKKFILDGLVMAGVLKGDSRKYVIGLEDDFSEIDPDNPRIVVTLTEV